jgi:23S rRNA-/tRNA-specific pseudouridylate synthase
MFTLTVEKDCEGMETFDFLIQAFPGFNKKSLIKAFKEGLISLNGNDPYVDDKVKEGDAVRVFVTGGEAGEDLTPEIIYQDENFVIADKPAGLLSTSDTGEPNAVNMVEEFMKERGEYSLEALMVPYLIYPLENEISGILVMAKHEDAYIFLSQALSQRRVTRYYTCAVVGEAEENRELRAYLVQDRSNRSVQITGVQRKDAKPIVTRYSKLAGGKGISLLSARPITNCLHQVRAHLAFEGLPIIGDGLYGDRKFDKRNKVNSTALWLKTILFEVGSGHEYAYINGRKFDSRSHSFPKCVYDAGLMEK